MEYPGGLVRPTTYAKSKLKLYLMIPPAQRTPSQIDEMANLIITLVNTIVLILSLKFSIRRFIF